MPTILLATLIVLGLLLAFAFLVVFWMVKTAVAESPESDPDRDAGRSEATIAADADRSASAIILPQTPDARRQTPNPKPQTINPVITPRRICAWCAIVLQEGDGPTSHGICPACAAVQTAQIEADWQTMHPHTTQRPSVVQA